VSVSESAAEPGVVRVHYQRLSARGLTIYTEHLVQDDGVRLMTEAWLPPDTSARISAAFWRQGLLAEGRRLTRICKYLFYHEYFDVIAVFDIDDVLAGYYVDILTPLRQVDGEYYVTDLFLDFWLAPGQPAMELDQDEFEEAVKAGVLTPEQIEQARATFARLRAEIAAGGFPDRYIRG